MMEHQVRPSQNSLLLQDLIYVAIIWLLKMINRLHLATIKWVEYHRLSAGVCWRITQLVSFEIKQFDLAFHKNILFSVFYNFEKAPQVMCLH